MSRKGGGYVQGVGIPWDLGYLLPIVLTPSGHHNTCGWHPIGMLSWYNTVSMDTDPLRNVSLVFQRYERQYENWQEVKAIYRDEQTRNFQEKTSLQKQLITSRDNLRELRQRELEEEAKRVSTFTTKGLFTRSVNVAVFVSGTFDLLDVMCRRCHGTAFNPFLNGMKNGDIDGTCKRNLNSFIQ